MKPPHLQHLVLKASNRTWPHSRHLRSFGVFGDPRFLRGINSRRTPITSNLLAEGERGRHR